MHIAAASAYRARNGDDRKDRAGDVGVGNSVSFMASRGCYALRAMSLDLCVLHAPKISGLRHKHRVNVRRKDPGRRGGP